MQEFDAGREAWQHGDVFPLPVPPPRSFVTTGARYLVRRGAAAACRHARVREGVLALNALAARGRSQVAASHQSAAAPNVAQRAAVSSIGQRVAQFPRDTEVRSDKGALFELLNLMWWNTCLGFQFAEEGVKGFDHARPRILPMGTTALYPEGGGPDNV